jgi:hypothetical protein
MSKARDIADLGSNDVLETTATGVDVTGTVSADGFQLGAGDKLYFNADRYFTPENNVDGAEVSANGKFTVKTGATPSKSLVVGATGDVSFYEDTGTTAKMVWDASAESLILKGNDLDLNNGTVLHRITNDNTNLLIRADYGNTNANSTIQFSLDGTERMRIDASGNVGIGTSTPANKLSVRDSSGGDIAFFTNAVDADLGINCTSGVTRLSPTTGTLALGTSSTERARIDSSGSLLVGTTNSEGKKLSIRDSYGISDETTKTITLTVAMGGSQTKNIGTFTGNAGATCSVHLIGGHHYSTASTGTSAPVGVIQMMAVTRLDGTGSVYSSINNVEVASSLKGGVALPTLEFTSSGLLRVVTAANQGCYAQLTIVHHGTFTR